MQETYGEDPHLTARLAVSFVRGLQGDQHLLKARLPANGHDCDLCCCHVPNAVADPDPYKYRLQVAATCKHFAAYSLEQVGGTTRFRFNAALHPR